MSESILVAETLYDEHRPNPETWSRVAIFTVAFLLSMILVLTNRLYIGPNEVDLPPNK